MSKRHLTAAAVDRIKPPPVGQVDHFDAGYPGLALRVSYGGSRTWVYFYRWQGKQRRLTLGPWPALEVSKARDAWRDARQRLLSGLEPIAAPASSPTAEDFATIAADWLRRDQSGNRSHDEVQRILQREVLPAWGHLRIGDIDRRQILDLIDGIADRGAVIMARRAHAHLHRLFRWSVGRGIIPVNPMTDMPKPGEEVRRSRVLSDIELGLAWKGAEQIGWPMGSALQLLVLTAARREEIAALRWSEIDRAGTAIHLEGDRTKNGIALTIPLSRPARELLAAVPRVTGSPFVFSTNGTTPISGWSRAKKRLDHFMQANDQDEYRGPWRIHDLRRTVATGMERLGVRLQVVEALLGHVAGSRAGVVGIYQRYNYENEKREAVEQWAAHVHLLWEGTS